MSRISICGESSNYFNTVEGVLYSSRYNTEISLFGKRVGEEYLTRCAEYFEHLPEDITAKLCAAAANYLNELIEEHAGEFEVEVTEFNSLNVMSFLCPLELHTESLRVLSEEDSPASFSVKLQFLPVPDECIEWTVCGDRAVYVGEYRGVSPWDERVSRKPWNYIGEG